MQYQVSYDYKVEDVNSKHYGFLKTRKLPFDTIGEARDYSKFVISNGIAKTIPVITPKKG